LIRPILLPS
jgi:Pyruvate/2-oxoglutarate dehydrogenase complex, dehydrogenase (E1) component, eukaryotic type, beta subunit